jgi:hypothetical protein
MLEFIQQGGVPSLVILLFSALAIFSAALFARSPSEKRRPVIRALSHVLLASIGLGVVSAFYNVLRFAANRGEASLEQVLLVGGSESLTPAIIGFAVLSVVYILVAVGERRLAH